MGGWLGGTSSLHGLHLRQVVVWESGEGLGKLGTVRERSGNRDMELVWVTNLGSSAGRGT